MGRGCNGQSFLVFRSLKYALRSQGDWHDAVMVVSCLYSTGKRGNAGNDEICGW